MSDERDFNKPFKLGLNKPPIPADGQYLRWDAEAYLICKDKRVDELVNVIEEILYVLENQVNACWLDRITNIYSRIDKIKNPTSGDQSE